MTTSWVPALPVVPDSHYPTVPLFALTVLYSWILLGCMAMFVIFNKSQIPEKGYCPSMFLTDPNRLFQSSPWSNIPRPFMATLCFQNLLRVLRNSTITTILRIIKGDAVILMKKLILISKAISLSLVVITLKPLVSCILNLHKKVDISKTDITLSVVQFPTRLQERTEVPFPKKVLWMQRVIVSLAFLEKLLWLART